MIKGATGRAVITKIISGLIMTFIALVHFIHSRHAASQVSFRQETLYRKHLRQPKRLVVNKRRSSPDVL